MGQGAFGELWKRQSGWFLASSEVRGQLKVLERIVAFLP